MDELNRQGLLAIIQWAIFVSGSLFYLVGAVFNGLIAWRVWYKKDSDGPSTAPLLFGSVGVLAVLFAPFGDVSDRWPFIWIPLVLDYGSGPYFLVVAYVLLTGSKR